MSAHKLTRRDFVAASTASALFAASPAFAAGGKRRVALVGTGSRGTGFWGKYLNDNYNDVIDYVGLCDINPGRLDYALDHMGVDCPVFTDFDAMLAEAKPDLVIVTTVDSTHDEFIVKGLDAGVDVVTEKPMTTDETKCQAILNAAEKSQGKLIVALNYRNGIIFSRLKEHLLQEKIGRLTLIDFHWYLNTAALCFVTSPHIISTCSTGGSTPNRSRYMPTVASSTTATTTLLGASAAWTARTRTSASSSGT
jgi:hypothetical protein